MINWQTCSICLFFFNLMMRNAAFWSCLSHSTSLSSLASLMTPPCCSQELPSVPWGRMFCQRFEENIFHSISFYWKTLSLPGPPGAASQTHSWHRGLAAASRAAAWADPTLRIKSSQKQGYGRMEIRQIKLSEGERSQNLILSYFLFYTVFLIPNFSKTFSPPTWELVQVFTRRLYPGPGLPRPTLLTPCD